jgi:hypothetical protein
MKNPKTNHPVLNKLSKDLDGWGNLFKELVDVEIKLNSKNFRCEEFVTNHNKEHLLFSGCSATFGYGLEEDELWSKKLYKKIKKDKEVSGYFNLAMPGIGCLEIVANIFKYINKFGNPNAIFIALPDVYRDYVEINSSENDKNPKYSVRHAIYDNKIYDKSLEVSKIRTFHYLLLLETYCKSNSIRLYYFSWDQEFPKMDLSRFFIFPQNDFIDFFKKNADNFAKEKYAVTSRDDHHVGTAYHDFWCDSFYNIYTGECETIVN